ncbi:hypothetical protein A4A49_53422 [Nicotiana attenuata]|uniref:Agenet-like domain-containing protein n=1 Tax=Nicotiana attenuata TaxID=49451 RepID=A0A1J6IPS9_NICAT|nr:hypothetical protein A4A49_53422 [Nicotiana attenuata]
MATMNDTEVKKGKPTNKYHFEIGDKVEVARKGEGYKGALYEGIIVERKGKNFVVQYHHLLLEHKILAEPNREIIQNRRLRPASPLPLMNEDEWSSFKVNADVDAFHFVGWWRGAVVNLVGGKARRL